MPNNQLDQPLLLQVLQALPGERAVDLEPVDEGRDGDEAVGLDILVELVGSGLVKDDGVLGLVLDCRMGMASVVCSKWMPIRMAASRQKVLTLALGPLLLLLLRTGSRGSHFGLSVWRLNEGWSQTSASNAGRIFWRRWTQGKRRLPKSND